MYPGKMAPSGSPRTESPRPTHVRSRTSWTSLSQPTFTSSTVVMTRIDEESTHEASKHFVQRLCPSSQLTIRQSQPADLQVTCHAHRHTHKQTEREGGGGTRRNKPVFKTALILE